MESNPFPRAIGEHPVVPIAWEYRLRGDLQRALPFDDVKTDYCKARRLPSNMAGWQLT
jgi:hypothetical protein